MASSDHTRISQIAVQVRPESAKHDFTNTAVTSFVLQTDPVASIGAHAIHSMAFRRLKRAASPYTNIGIALLC
eukprot:13671954-Alexandrium_andersonii.AAC.1